MFHLTSCVISLSFVETRRLNTADVFQLLFYTNCTEIRTKLRMHIYLMRRNQLYHTPLWYSVAAILSSYFVLNCTYHINCTDTAQLSDSDATYYTLQLVSCTHEYKNTTFSMLSDIPGCF